MNRTMSSLALLFLLQINSLGQTTSDKIKYKASGIYLITQDTNGKETNRLPFGKNVYVYVDKFFKSYSIGYQTEEGSVALMDLKYVKSLENRTLKMFYKNQYYFLKDDLNNGSLILISPESTKFEIVLLTISDASKFE